MNTYKVTRLSDNESEIVWYSIVKAESAIKAVEQILNAVYSLQSVGNAKIRPDDNKANRFNCMTFYTNFNCEVEQL